MYYNRNYVHKSNVLGAGLIAFFAGAAVWALIGKKMTDKINQSSEFQDLKKEVYDKASKISDLTQERYNSVVDEVSDRYAKARGISQNELRDLVDDLKWHWKRIKSSWNDENRWNSPDNMSDRFQS